VWGGEVETILSKPWFALDSYATHLQKTALLKNLGSLVTRRLWLYPDTECEAKKLEWPFGLLWQEAKTKQINLPISWDLLSPNCTTKINKLFSTTLLKANFPYWWKPPNPGFRENSKIPLMWNLDPIQMLNKGSVIL